MKKVLWLLVSAFALVTCFSTVTLAQTARFGEAIPLTGPYAAMAEDMKRGSMLALEEINAAGGVLGKPAEVLITDSQLKADVTIRRFKDMMDQGYKFIGGSLSGGISLVGNEFACKNKLLYMAFCHTSIPVGKEFCGYGFTSAVIPYQPASALANYAFKNFGKKWMSLTADYRWGHDNLAAWLVNSEKYGGEFLGNIYHPLGTRDFSAFIPQILAKKPDFLVVTNYGTDQASAIKQLAELGLTKKMKIVISKTHIITIKETGAAFDENVYGSSTFYWHLQDKYPEAKTFVKTFWDKYGSPPSQDGECAYTATKVVFSAMNKAGVVDDVDKVIETIVSNKWPSPKGPTEWRPCDHARLQSICILQGKGAKAKDWDVATLVAEVPYTETLESCENNKKDIPYGQVKLPGK